MRRTSEAIRAEPPSPPGFGAPRNSAWQLLGGTLSSDGLLIPITFLLTFILSTPLHAIDSTFMDSDESTMFESEQTLTTSANSTEIAVFGDQRSVNFSGRLDSLSAYGINRNWMAGRGSFSNNILSSYNQADLFLDVRLTKGIKMFTDASFTSLPTAVSTSNASTVAFDIKELFVDFNVDRQLYVRSGKQFMQWGRGYFWNPVDFVNTSQRSFFNLDAIRAGVYGTRLHWSLGQNQNAYAFFDMTDATNLTDVSLLMRYEWLSDTTEWGISAWNQYEAVSRFGLDMSTHTGIGDLTGELALANGTNQDVVSGAGVAPIRDRWVMDAALGLSQTLNWERPARITIHEELFYNGAGYSDNILADPTRYALLFTNGLYRANYLSSWYTAAFISISEFPGHSSTWSTNIIHNCVDSSGILSTGLSYQVVDGLRLGPTLALYYGDATSEYLLAGYGLSVLLQATVTF